MYQEFFGRRGAAATGTEEEEIRSREFRTHLDAANDKNFLAVVTRYRGPELTRNKSVCLSKALLSSVAAPSQTGFQLYSEYFAPLTLVAADSNLSCLKRKKGMSRRVRASLYGKSWLRNPAFFSIENSGDVNRLAGHVNSEIVIYYTDKGYSPTFLDIFHDFRSLATRVKPKTLFFVLSAAGELYRLPDNVSLDRAYVISRPVIFSKSKTDWIGERLDGCLAQTVSFLLDFPRPCKGQLRCPTHLDLQSIAAELYSFWCQRLEERSLPPPPITLVVAYCKNKTVRTPPSQLCRRRTFSRCSYTTVAVIGPNCKASTAQSAERVVVLFGGNAASVCPPDHGKLLTARFAKLAQEEADLGPASNYQGLPSLSREQIATAAAAARKKSRTKIKLSDRIAKICECEMCLRKDYDGNMSKSGPEQLCTVQLDVRDLLEMLNATDEVYSLAAESLCQLSVAAFDIESMTVALSQPRPESVVSYSEIDFSSLAGHTKKVQKPIMVAHTDYATYEEQQNDGDRVVVLTAESDSERSIYRLMERYWSVVVAKQAAAAARKQIAAKPLYDLTEAYREAHLAFVEDYAARYSLDRCGKQYQSMLAMWSHTIPGKLRGAVDTLVREYTIFSFYG